MLSPARHAWGKEVLGASSAVPRDRHVAFGSVYPTRLTVNDNHRNDTDDLILVNTHSTHSSYSHGELEQAG